MFNKTFVIVIVIDNRAIHDYSLFDTNNVCIFSYYCIFMYVLCATFMQLHLIHLLHTNITPS